MRNTADEGQRTMSCAVAVTIVLSLLSSAFAEPALAKSARSAVVVQVNGDVTYTKSGGSRSNTVYQDLALNQGDTISTGSGASVVLRIVDRDDELTIGENAEVYISDLMENGGAKKSKLKAWAGSMWSKVKSLVSSEDEFEVETPTAVMGVRGTQFFTYVHPLTGKTVMVVAAGIVQAKTVAPDPSSQADAQIQTTRAVTVYPAQQISLDMRMADLRTRVDYANIEDIVNTAPPAVLKTFVENIPAIQEENERIKQKLLEQFNQGIQKPNESSILKFQTADDVKKVNQNMDAVILNLVKTAIDEKKIDQELIDEVNQKMEGPLKKLDLNRIPQIDKDAGIDPEVEKAKQEQPASPPKAKEETLLQENRDRLGSAAIQILEENEKLTKEANNTANKEERRRAEDTLKSTMTPEDKKVFEQNQQMNQNQNPTSTPTPNNSNNDDSGSTPPNAPVVKSAPQKALKNQSITVVLGAEAGSKIKLNNETKDVVNGEASFTVSAPSTLGTFKLNAVTISSSGISANQEISIEVVEPKVTLSQVGAKANHQIKLKLDMENFLDALPFYAVEAHVVYNKADFDYEAPAAGLPKDDGTVFDGVNSAETLRQEVGAMEKELIFAGTRFDASIPNQVPQINLRGETKTLVFAPLTVMTSAPSTQVKLVYVKVVDKDGKTVYELPVSEAALLNVKLN